MIYSFDLNTENIKYSPDIFFLLYAVEGKKITQPVCLSFSNLKTDRSYLQTPQNGTGLYLDNKCINHPKIQQGDKKINKKYMAASCVKCSLQGLYQDHTLNERTISFTINFIEVYQKDEQILRITLFQ